MTLLAAILAILVALIMTYDGRVPVFAVLGGFLVGMAIEHVVQARARVERAKPVSEHLHPARQNQVQARRRWLDAQ